MCHSEIMFTERIVMLCTRTMWKKRTNIINKRKKIIFFDMEVVQNSGLFLCNGVMLSKTSFRNKMLSVVDIQRWVHTHSYARFNCYGFQCHPHSSSESGGEMS